MMILMMTSSSFQHSMRPTLPPWVGWSKCHGHSIRPLTTFRRHRRTTVICRRPNKPGMNHDRHRFVADRGIYSEFPPNANSHHVGTNFVAASFGNTFKVSSLPLHYLLAHAGLFATPLSLTSCFLYTLVIKTTLAHHFMVMWPKLCLVLFFLNDITTPRR